MTHGFVGTSAFYAYLVQDDRYHLPVRAVLTDAVSSGRVLASPSLVLGEILGLLQIRHGLEAAGRFMTDIYPLVLWRWVDRTMFAEVWRLVEERNRRGFTAVDASLVVSIRERPGSFCIAVDKDLSGFGFEVVPQI